MQGTTDNIKIC